MSNIDGLFNRSVVNVGKGAIESAKNSGSNRSDLANAKLFINALLILLIIGADGAIIVFRSNFGGKGINLTRTMLCAICFAYISYLLFTQNHLNFDIDDSPSTTLSFYISSAIYAALSAHVLIKVIFSFVKARKENPKSDYKGDSSLFGFLEDYGYSRRLIQNLMEPFYTIIFGILLYFYNPIAGVPIVFCGISLLLVVLFDLIFGGSAINSMKRQLQTTNNKNTIINQVSD